MHTASAAPPMASLLGYGGLLPFLAGAVLAWAGAIDPALASRAFVGYGAAILAFLGGLQWGIALLPDTERLAERLVVGVLPALAAWVALLLPTFAALVLLLAAFAALLAWEHARPARALPPWYLPLRLRLTLIVAVCHVAVGIAVA